MKNSIKKMLRLTDNYLEVTDISYETIHKQNTLVIDTTFSPDIFTCHNCGSPTLDAQGKTVVVRNGKKVYWCVLNNLITCPL